MKRTLRLALALSLTSSMALAQGVLTDGDVRFEYISFAPPSEASVNFEVNLGIDHVFGQWWWFRIDCELAETRFPEPDTQSYIGNVATLDWADVDGRGFSAREVVTLTDGPGAQAGTTRHDLTVTNNSGGSLVMNLYHYADFDLDLSAGGDSAILGAPNGHIRIAETSIADWRGLGADAYQVDSFPNVRNLLQDTLATNLSNSGLPFGPGEFTGAMQWQNVTIADGASFRFTAVKSINDPGAVSDELSFLGSCPGPLSVRISDVTPNGQLAVVSSPNLGLSKVPAGNCAGTLLDLGNPSLITIVPANASGELRRDFNAQESLCGQFIQVVDLTTCGVSNVDPIPDRIGDDPNEIPPGCDCWHTPCGRTKVSFCDRPIPANTVFGPGSDEFNGEVRLQGRTGGIDTQVQRFDSVLVPDVGLSGQTRIELVELDLVSCQPIQVTIDGQPTLWNVEVGLSEARPSPPQGLMAIHKTHPNGGTFESQFLVQPRFVFTNVDDPKQVTMLDTGMVGIPPDDFLGVPPSPWVHELSPDLSIGSCGTNFVPGVLEEDVEPQCCVDVCHMANAPSDHCIVVDVDCSLCPVGACCDPTDGFCEVLTRSDCDLLGRDYKGHGTDCTTDTDGDGVPDVLESNNCCTGTDPCNTGTNPTLADTDGDGVIDGDEIDSGTDPCDELDP